VVDDVEIDYYQRKFGQFLSAKPERLVLISVSTVALEINVGRKRQVTKLFAEFFKIPRYWVLDDDLFQWKEYDLLGTSMPCSLARCLIFCQLVMEEERHGIVQELEQKQQRPSKTNSLADDGFKGYLEARKKWFKHLHNIPEEVALRFNEQLVCTGDEQARELWNDPERLLAMIPEQLSAIREEVLGLYKQRQFRIAQVALAAHSLFRFADIRDQLPTPVTHEASTSLYQIVLFDREATLGIDYMTTEDFFTICPLSKEEKQNLKRVAKSTNASKWPKDSEEHHLVKAAKWGYCGEDKYINCRLLENGRVGYLVYRYEFSSLPSDKNPSIVEGVSELVNHEDIQKEIEKIEVATV